MVVAIEAAEVVKAVVTVLVVDGMVEAEVEVATEVAAVPSNAVANTKVPFCPAVVGMTVARAVES